MTSSKKCPQKAIIFARVSSSNQEAGCSLNAQVARLQEYCKQKNLEVIKEFCITESSITKDRKQFREVIDFAQNQQEKIVLVVDSIDRLQRGFKEISIIDELIQKDIIEVHFNKESSIVSKNSSSTDMLRWNMMALFAKGYSDYLSNIKRVINAKLKKDA